MNLCQKNKNKHNDHNIYARSLSIKLCQFFKNDSYITHMHDPCLSYHKVSHNTYAQWRLLTLMYTKIF